jgi:hypothetical protein
MLPDTGRGCFEPGNLQDFQGESNYEDKESEEAPHGHAKEEGFQKEQKVV